MKRGTVVNRKRDLNGDSVGTRNTYSLLDSRLYKVELKYLHYGRPRRSGTHAHR